MSLANFYTLLGDNTQAEVFNTHAANRKQLINTYLWSDEYHFLLIIIILKRVSLMY
ncbi:trehalase family glycosidase (plasmid) [Pseudoalteromonas espejiana]